VFSAWCDAEQSEVLLSPRRITSIRFDRDSVEIDFTCWCGHQGATRDRRVRRVEVTSARPTAMLGRLPQPA